MKRIIYIFLLGIISILSACDSEKDLVVVEPVERIANLYGLGTIFGWDSNAPTTLLQSTTDPNLFVVDKVIKYSEENKQFKFILEKGDWDKVRYLVPNDVDYNGNVKIVTNGEYKMFQCSEGEGNLRDYFWGIPEGEDGTYRITINPKLLTMKIEKLNSNTDPIEPEVKTIYGLGASFSWDSNSPTPLTPDTFNPDNIFTIKVELNYSAENKLFKFIREKGDWDKVRYLVPTDVDYNGNVKIATEGEYDIFECSEGEDNLRDHFWGIPEGEDGTYILTVNLTTKKLKVEKDRGELFGLGIAFGWDSNQPTALTPVVESPNTFTAQVTLSYTEENKQFKFCLEKGDWDKVRYLVPTEVDHNGNVKLIADGEYDMFLCSEGEGNLRDHFWGIPQGKDGDYQLTVNIATKKLTVKKLEE